MSATLENVTSTTAPFVLDVGKHAFVLAGDFNGALCIFERKLQDAHDVWAQTLPAFSSLATVEFTVVPNGTGLYRLRVIVGPAKPPKLNLIIGSPPSE
jgi:hypothetical protein